MTFKLFENGELVNIIVASHAFVDAYANEMGYTYELVPEPEPEAPEPSQEEDLMAMAIDHEYRLTLLELGVTEI